jgi:hypothetical protein
MIRQQFYIIILASVCFVHCKQRQSGSKFKAIMADTTLRDESDLLKAFPDFTRKVHLPSLENGVDSFEYRFWLPGEANIINLIRIRYDSSKWVLTETIIYNHIPNYDFSRLDKRNHLLDVVVDSTATRSIVPTIAIDAFIDSLQGYNFERAPSNIQLAGSFALPTDAWSYTIELAAKNSYRIILYTCPCSTNSLEWFHNSFGYFLKFIRTILNTNFIPC